MTDRAYKIDCYVPAYNQAINVNIASQLLRDSMHVAEAGHSYRFWSQHTCDLVAMRNQALDRALKDGFDFLMMQDSDVYSPAPTGPLMPLLETALETEATVTGAMVSMRTRPPRANVWPCHPGQVFEADKIGTGMVLLDLNRVRDWYDEYQGPCFQRVYENDKAVHPTIGMDIFFCYVVRDHGGRVVCDGRVPTVHVDAISALEYDGQEVPDLAESRVAATGG
jgi:hypothetical protein